MTRGITLGQRRRGPGVKPTLLCSTLHNQLEGGCWISVYGGVKFLRSIDVFSLYGTQTALGFCLTCMFNTRPVTSLWSMCRVGSRFMREQILTCQTHCFFTMAENPQGEVDIDNIIDRLLEGMLSLKTTMLTLCSSRIAAREASAAGRV